MLDNTQLQLDPNQRSRVGCCEKKEDLSANLVMMKAVLAFLVLFVCFNVGYGLKCYTCVSTKSWGDCEDIKKESTCPPTYNRCAKISVDVKKGGVSVEEYGKTCLTEEMCSATEKVDLCKGAGECKVNCCSGDLCNAASFKIMSTFILLTCVLVALIQ